MPGGQALGPGGGKGAALQLPEFLREPFSAAMSQSMLLPAFIALFGVVAALFMLGFIRSARADDQRPRADAADDRVGHQGGSEARTRRIRVRPSASQHIPDDHRSGYRIGHDDVFQGFRDGFDDDDDYVEYTLSPARTAAPERSRAVRPTQPRADERKTEPLPVHAEHPRPAPAETWHSAPVESWHSLLDDPASEAQPIGFAHNGFHVDDERRFRPIEEFAPPPKPSRPQKSGTIGDRDRQFVEDTDARGRYPRPSRHELQDPSRCGRTTRATAHVTVRVNASRRPTAPPCRSGRHNRLRATFVPRSLTGRHGSSLECVSGERDFANSSTATYTVDASAAVNARNAPSSTKPAGAAGR